MKVEIWGIFNAEGQYIGSWRVEDVEGAKRHASCVKGNLVMMAGELSEPKRKVKLAPALCRTTFGCFWLSDDLYDSEQDAKNGCPDFFRWPAPQPDEEGFIEIEVEG